MKNLFKEAPEKTKAVKDQKIEVVIDNDAVIAKTVNRLITVSEEIDKLSAEKAILYADIKDRGISEFKKLYAKLKKFPGSFNIKIKGTKLIDYGFLFIPTEKYAMVDKDRATELQKKYGADIITKESTYVVNSVLVEKYGETISKLIHGCKEITDTDKDDLISVVTNYSISKGAIEKIPELKLKEKFKDEEEKLTSVLGDFGPAYQLKNIKIAE